MSRPKSREGYAVASTNETEVAVAALAADGTFFLPGNASAVDAYFDHVNIELVPNGAIRSEGEQLRVPTDRRRAPAVLTTVRAHTESDPGPRSVSTRIRFSGTSPSHERECE
jgi:hypothetical protein